MITTSSFAPVTLREDLLPASIYGDAPYRTVPLCVQMPIVMQAEIQRFLQALLAQGGCAEEGTYFRIDAYLNRGVLWVLEVTTQYIDGWGIALNLLRASGNPITLPPAFPSVWVLDNPLYRPEIELDAREIALATAGVLEPHIVTPEVFDTRDDLVYWYGWKAPDHVRIRPAYGRFLEDKIHLQRLSSTWSGDRVQIPPTYMIDERSWDDLPFPVVCKNRRKNVGVYGNVALCQTRADTGKQARRAYERREAVAQAFVEPYRYDDVRPTQLEILCIGTKPVTGYILQGDPNAFVLNDRAAHGPLILL